MTAPYTVLFSAEAVQKRVAELAVQISADYSGKRLLCLVVLRGGFFFGADLVRQLKGVEVELEFVKLASYSGRESSGRLLVTGPLPRVSGYDVLVIEDLVDTGLTLSNLHEALLAQGPNSLRYAIVVDKKARRKIPFECEYVAFDVQADTFLVGYGMDDENKGRTLPYIGKVNHQA
ncbi:MAG: hypoxanthine phosphoribosyltransferase [Planctomycetes bacterium]|nr:hypoxanthine phosphoribosyltransferase [Planctomycetota bacterium]MCB9934178.1 hypoxanthine phosphoribosyltransferase [Planctomycetota bacterium]